MLPGQKLWTRDELILAINLYCKQPFGKLHSRNPEIINLANIIGRTPSSVAYKLVNLASLDPSLKQRGIKGASNASKLDKEIWDEFYNNWDELFLFSEQTLAELKKTTVEQLNDIDLTDIPEEGLEKLRLAKTRLNQNIFRALVLATYNNTCCITGISNTELIIASHIMPWSQDKQNRMNPMNGLALNALHDKAFEHGLITIDADSYKIKVSPSLFKNNSLPSIEQNFLDYHGKEILLPKKFLPDRAFLKVHNDQRFRSA